MTEDMHKLAQAQGPVSRLRYLARENPERYRRVLALALVELGYACHELGRHADAVVAVEEAIAIERLLLSEREHDRDTALSELAAAFQARFDITGELDDLNEAITTLRQALNAVPREHQDRAALLSNLGNALRKRYERTGAPADLAETVRLQRQAVAAAFADDHDRTALLSNLGTALRLWFEVTGDIDSLDEAVAVFRQAVAATRQSSQSRTLRLSNLGAALRARYERTGDVSDLDEAESLLRLAVRDARSDDDGRATLRSNLANVLRDLASVLHEPDKLIEAQAEFTAALVVRERVLGAEHPDTLASRNNLASVLAQRGELAEAEREFRALAGLQERVLGAEHPDTLASRNNLASVLAQRGELAEAEREFRAVLGVRQVVLGSDHPDTLTTHALLTAAEDSLATSRADAAQSQAGLPMPHRGILAVDITGSAHRSNSAQLALRRGLYDVVRGSLADVALPWDSCAVEDREDGLLVLVPPDVPKIRLIEAADRLEARLHKYNAASAGGQALRLRLSIHAGEVHIDAHGVAGSAVIHAFRLLDAPQLKAASTVPGRDLALIVSDWFYREVVQHDPTESALDYRPVNVNVKETKTVAWLRTRKAALPSDHVEVPEPAGKARPDFRMVAELTDALLAVPAIADPSGRRALVSLLQPRIADAITEYPRARAHVVEIVRTCLKYEDGLDRLLEVIRLLEASSLSLRNLEMTIAKVLHRGEPQAHQSP